MEMNKDELIDLIYASTQTGETAFGLAGHTVFLKRETTTIGATA